MADPIGWLIQKFDAAQRARCSSCGERAKGRVLYGPFDDDVPTAIVCENCGKRWNIGVQMDSEADPYERYPKP